MLRHERNRGIGAALKTGVRAATLPWVTFLPCDGQIAPQSLETLLSAAQAQDLDVVFSVYLDRDDGWHRTAMSAGIRALIQAMFRVNMRSDGPYLFRRELFDPDLLLPDTFFLNFEFPIRALAPGAAPRRRAHPVRPAAVGPQQEHGAGTGWPAWPAICCRSGCDCRRAAGRHEKILTNQVPGPQG